MASKYYAVKVGRITGLFDNWDECKSSVDGFPGALYKSFKSISDAYTYLGWESEQISLFDIDTLPSDEHSSLIRENHSIPFSDSRHATAYVDGSYNVTTGHFSYGVVMFFNNEEIHLSEMMVDDELALMRNVAGEIYGSMAAMKFAVEKGCKELTIYHDYEGIAKWCLGLWKATKPGTIAYKNYYDSIKKTIHIRFEKVKGHSGDKYNDLADSLAKKAAGIE